LGVFKSEKKRKSKAGKGFWVSDLKIDTDEVRGSSPSGLPFIETQEPPEKVKVCFGFVREETGAGTYELSDHPDEPVFGSFGGQKVPADPGGRSVELVEGNLPLVGIYGRADTILHFCLGSTTR
jgi:hypothetical protein